jgi:hypothetical protein
VPSVLFIDESVKRFLDCEWPHRLTPDLFLKLFILAFDLTNRTLKLFDLIEALSYEHLGPLSFPSQLSLSQKIGLGRPFS